MSQKKSGSVKKSRANASHVAATFHHATAAHHHRQAHEHRFFGNHELADHHHAAADDHSRRASDHSSDAKRHASDETRDHRDVGDRHGSPREHWDRDRDDRETRGWDADERRVMRGGYWDGGPEVRRSGSGDDRMPYGYDERYAERGRDERAMRGYEERPSYHGDRGDRAMLPSYDSVRDDRTMRVQYGRDARSNDERSSSRSLADSEQRERREQNGRPSTTADRDDWRGGPHITTS